MMRKKGNGQTDFRRPLAVGAALSLLVVVVGWLAWSPEAVKPAESTAPLRSTGPRIPAKAEGITIMPLELPDGWRELSQAGASPAARQMKLPWQGRELAISLQAATTTMSGGKAFALREGGIDGEAFSHVACVAYEGRVFASLHRGDGSVMELEADPEGRAFLRSYDYRKLPPCGCDEADADGLRGPRDHDYLDGVAPAEGGFTTDCYGEGEATLDVLVVFNNAARVAMGGSAGTPGDDAALRAKVIAAVSAANAAYRNSGVPLKMQLLGLRPVSYSYSVFDDFDVALDELDDPWDGELDEVHEWQEDLGADIVSLWLSNEVTGGLAYVSLPESSPRPYNVVRVQNPVDTFVHEVGHNQGCRHMRSGYPTVPTSWNPWSFGYGFTAADGITRTCVMATYSDGEAIGATGRLLLFSNPRATCAGTPAGTIDEDCARTLEANRFCLESLREFQVGRAEMTPSPMKLGLSGAARNSNYRVSRRNAAGQWIAGQRVTTDYAGNGSYVIPQAEIGKQGIFRFELEP